MQSVVPPPAPPLASSDDMKEKVRHSCTPTKRLRQLAQRPQMAGRWPLLCSNGGTRITNGVVASRITSCEQYSWHDVSLVDSHSKMCETLSSAIISCVAVSGGFGLLDLGLSWDDSYDML